MSAANGAQTAVAAASFSTRYHASVERRRRHRRRRRRRRRRRCRRRRRRRRLAADFAQRRLQNAARAPKCRHVYTFRHVYMRARVCKQTDDAKV